MVAARRILIVEDDHIVQLHLRVILKDLGYEVTGVASSNAEALASVRQIEPHLVLMDVRLAGSPDGIETARELRARHPLEVVFLSAYADEATVDRAQEVGAAGYLVKPFSKPQLRATLSTVFARSSGPQARPAASGPEGAPTRFGAGTRVAIFSHDTLGLGHLQRNLNLSWALNARFPGVSILLLTGSAMQHRFRMPPSVDTIKLPSVRKLAADHYEPRSLQMGASDVRELRSHLTLRALQSYRPHVLLVDHAPLGMGGELLNVLEWLKRNRPQCVRMIGLRDIIDSPHNVEQAWSRQRMHEVLEQLYDHVVIYGSPRIYDATSAYGFSPELRAKTFYCGFVSRSRPDEVEADEVERQDLLPRGERPLVVVTIGGGDGAGQEVLGTYLQMLRQHPQRSDFDSVLLTGPLIDPELAARLRSEARDLPVRLVEFVPSTRAYLEHADLVVCTGGYNTMVEVATFADRALVIPRRMHREEQWLRAETFAQLGLVAVLDPAEITPDRLLAEITTQLGSAARPLARAREQGILDLDGAQRFAEFCSRIEVNS